MSKILIFSDDIKLNKLWLTALSQRYTVDISDKLDENADLVIIDFHKLENDENLFSSLTHQSTRFLIVGSNWSEEQQIKALTYGASGYCAESDPPTLLLKAVSSVLKGDIWIQRHLVPKVIGSLIQMKSSNKQVMDKDQSESRALINTLSNRELDVAQMIKTGENNKSIASGLNISERTVKAHLSSIFKKLNVPDRLHLAVFIKDYG